MVKYKVNLKFKENGKSLNETITEVLKIELNKIINKTCNIPNLEVHVVVLIIPKVKGAVIDDWE